MSGSDYSKVKNAKGRNHIMSARLKRITNGPFKKNIGISEELKLQELGRIQNFKTPVQIARPQRQPMNNSLQLTCIFARESTVV